MTLNKALYSILVLTLTSSLALGEKSLEEIVRSRADESSAISQNQQSTSAVPGYSEATKEEIENNLNSIKTSVETDHLKREGEKIREEQINNNPDGVVATIVEASDLKRIKGFEGYSELEMFKEADKYMKSPLEQVEILRKEGCEEKINNSKKGFFSKTTKQTFEDEIEELKSCEAPITNFKCTKALEVSCTKIDECEYGGIIKESVDSGIAFDARNGFLTIGTDCDDCLRGTCATFDKTVSFSISKVASISSFHLIHVKFDDYLQLILNGHVIYVGPDGGSHVEVITRDEERERTVKRGRRRVSEKYKEQVTEVFNGHEYRPCERSASHSFEMNTDLRPYLIEGKNTLQMRIIVSGAGEGWLKIKAKEQCCADNDWEEKWVESCEQES